MRRGKGKFGGWGEGLEVGEALRSARRSGWHAIGVRHKGGDSMGQEGHTGVGEGVYAGPGVMRSFDQQGVRGVRVCTVTPEGEEERDDRVAVEEALEIQVGHTVEGERRVEAVSVTMRTPGDDGALAVGLLHAEGCLRSPDEVHAVLCGRGVARVELAPWVAFELDRVRRRVMTTASCGLCGTLARELPSVAPVAAPLRVADAVLYGLPGGLRRRQEGFASTGGLHAAGLFTRDGTLLDVREDVGRHNAVDKLIGHAFLGRRLPLGECGLVLSGRVAFELVVKAARAGIPLIAAVGAPSSLAVELAEEAGITLVGFLREDRFNVYTRPGCG